MYAYIIILYTVKSEIIEEQNQIFEDEMKTVEKQMQKLRDLSGKVNKYPMKYSNETIIIWKSKKYGLLVSGHEKVNDDQ